MFSLCFIIFLMYGTLFTYASPKSDFCIQQGIQCSEDCTSVLYCSEAGVLPVLSVNCSLNAGNKTNCYSNYSTIAYCSDKSDCVAPQEQLPIICKQAGDFPDPYDCRKSYTCESGNPKPVKKCTCPSGSLFDGFLDCGGDQADIQACCRDFEVDCDNNNIGGNYGSCSLSSLGYYYICERGSGITSIGLYQCPTDSIFSTVTYTCVPKETEINIPVKEKKIADSKLVEPVCEPLDAKN